VEPLAIEHALVAGPEDRNPEALRPPCLEVDASSPATNVGDQKTASADRGHNLRVDPVCVWSLVHDRRSVPCGTNRRLQPEIA
jgi:hypothetical protein